MRGRSTTGGVGSPAAPVVDEEPLDELLALIADVTGSSLAVIDLPEPDRSWFARFADLRLPRADPEPAGLSVVADVPIALAGVDATLRLYADRPPAPDRLRADRLAAFGRQVGHQLAMRRRIAELTTTPVARSGRDGAPDHTGALSEHRWQQVFDASPVGIGLSDEHGLFVAANPALCRLLGRSEAELIGRTAADFTYIDDLSSHGRAGALISGAEDGVARVEKRYVRPDGSVRWAWLAATHVDGPDGRTWTLTHVQDVTEHKAIEESVRISEANLAAVAEVMQSIHTGSDARQAIVNSGLELAEASVVCLLEQAPSSGELVVSATTRADATGRRLPADSIVGQVLAAGAPLLIADGAGDAIAATLRSELELRHIGSALITPVRSTARAAAVLVVGWSSTVAGSDDRRVSLVSLLADQVGVALRQASLVAELEAQALTDPLTGLPNRRGWERALAASLHRADRSGVPLTVAVIDLDHFKKFNDTHGHATGDHLLVRFAEIAERQLRGGDVFARWGGEEFVIALQDCESATAAAVLERIRSVVPYGQTCSIGYAAWNGSETADELTARADLAMYAAKHGGRDRVSAWQPSGER